MRYLKPSGKISRDGRIRRTEGGSRGFDHGSGDQGRNPGYPSHRAMRATASCMSCAERA